MYDGKPDLWSHLAHLCKILNLLLFLLCILVIVKFHLPRDHICLCAWHLPVLPVPAWVLSGLSSFLPQYKGPQMSAEPRTFCITGWPNKEEIIFFKDPLKWWIITRWFLHQYLHSESADDTQKYLKMLSKYYPWKYLQSAWSLPYRALSVILSLYKVYAE